MQFIIYIILTNNNYLLLISSYALHIVIKSWTDISDITLEVPVEMIGGAAAVKFQNKV